MEKQRRFRILDRVECIAEMDPTKGLYCEKGQHYNLCEVSDPTPWFVKLLIGVFSGEEPQDEEYGVRVIGMNYSGKFFNRASDFKLVTPFEGPDQVARLMRGERPDTEN